MYIKPFKVFRLMENTSVIASPPPPTKPRKITGGDDDDDKSLSYYSEWLSYWMDNEYPSMFSEIWRDEKYRRNMDDFKETKSFIFYSKLWYEHKFDHSIVKQDIEKEISDFTNKYNTTVYELDRQKEINKEIDDIMNTHEEDFGNITLRYKLEKPSKPQVNRFIKSGDSEEAANKKLFSVISLEGTNEPEDLHSDEWKKWVKEVYNPFFEKEIVPFVEKNGWRLWVY